jgi:hypothetical protein
LLALAVPLVEAVLLAVMTLSVAAAAQRFVQLPVLFGAVLV